MTLTEEQQGTVGFDLEAARAGIAHYRIENPSNVDTESHLKDLVDQANLAEEYLAEIERLREGAIKGNQFVNELMANCNSLRERVWKADARIKELEDALVEERAGAIRCESYDHCEGMYRIDLPDAMIRAQQELQAEGKIGPDAKPRVWQITEERKAAIWHAVAVLKENDPDDEHLWDEEIAVLRAMLREAE